MTETVCVTAEQLREWRKRILLTLLQHESTCAEHSGGICDCGNNATWLSMEEALGQAERLKDWCPEVGDRVRLRAMPEVRGTIAKIFDKTAYIQVDGEPEDWRLDRYLAELMPEEGE